MRRLIAAVAGIFCIAVAASADDASLRKAIERARSDYVSTLQFDTAFDIPSLRVEKTVSRAVLDGGDAPAVVASVAKSLGVSSAAAKALIEARLLLAFASLENPSAEEQKSIDELLAVALREAPSKASVVTFYASASGGNREKNDEQFVAALRLLTRSLKPAEVATVAETQHGRRAMLLIADALHRAPDEPQLHDALTNLYDKALNQTFGPLSFATGKAAFRRSWRGRDAATIAGQAAQQIAALAEAGRADDALAALDALPLPVRALLLAGRVDRDGQKLDVRLDLAAAAFVAGDKARAATLARGAAAGSSLDLLGAALAPKIDHDLYGVLTASIGSGDGVWAMLFADVARRDGYDAVADNALRNANRNSPTQEEEQSALDVLPESLRAELQTALVRQDAALTKMHASLAPIPSGEALLKRLQAPRTTFFIERPLPEAIAARDRAVIDCSDAQRVAASMHIPPGWYPIRLERAGDEVAGIAVSGALDPVGEISRGAYWVLHSRDGGQTWDEPLYTGLRENWPYFVLPASKMPLISGDHLDVEVQIREIDPTSISFPPVGLRTMREARGLYLELPWATLARDSDNDGLTDIVEERLGTDMHDADSDGDGIPDGKDGLPLVALGASKSAEAEVLAAILQNFYPGSGALIVGLPATAEERNACVVRASVVGSGALFVVGDRRLFTPIDINRRIVVLTREEADAYGLKFGPTFGADINAMIVRHDGKKALVIIDETWTGETFELEKTEGGWTMKVVNKWIT